MESAFQTNRLLTTRISRHTQSDPNLRSDPREQRRQPRRPGKPQPYHLLADREPQGRDWPATAASRRVES